MAPVACERIAVKISCKEVVRFDEERSHIVTEGEGEHAKTRTVWEHHTHKSKEKIFKQVIVVSQVGHMLPPGEWAYPFSYTIPAGLPGVVKYKKSSRSSDPHWHDPLVQEASVVFKLKACIETAGAFSRDLKSRQECVAGGGGAGEGRGGGRVGCRGRCCSLRRRGGWSTLGAVVCAVCCVCVAGSR